MLTTQDGKELTIYPESAVPLEAINSPCEFHEYGRLSTGSPFCAFDLDRKEKWTSSYCYQIPAAFYKNMVGKVSARVEVRLQKGTWHKVTQESFFFGSHPFHLQQMRGKSQAILVYNRPTIKGDTLYCIDNMGDLKIVLKK